MKDRKALRSYVFWKQGLPLFPDLFLRFRYKQDKISRSIAGKHHRFTNRFDVTKGADSV